jgi:hypothetical protein
MQGAVARFVSKKTEKVILYSMFDKRGAAMSK